MEKRTKIGIVTFWTASDNYGQILQCYALQSFLRNMGYNAFLIKYEGKAPDMKQKYRRLLKIFNPCAVTKYLKRKMNDNHGSYRDFDIFIKEHIVSTEIYSAKRLKFEPPSADIYICGSDQIWNKKFIGTDENYFLGFAPAGSRKISYAASFGGCEFSDEEITIIYKLLSDFELVSVREKEGIETCRRAGRSDAVKALDPTMLLDADEYRRLAIKQNSGRKYILLYLLGHPTPIDIAAVYKYALEKGLEVIYVPSHNRFDSYPKTYPTISEWLGLISDAQYVITNSFHGTVFSILFNKQFSVAVLSGEEYINAMNNRITDLLSSICFGDRILSSDISRIEEPMDYKTANVTLKKEREKIKELLSQVIKKS